MKPYLVLFATDGAIESVTEISEGEAADQVQRIVVWAADGESAIKQALALRNRRLYAERRARALAEGLCLCGNRLDTWKHGRKSRLLKSCSVCLHASKEATERFKERKKAGQVAEHTNVETRDIRKRQRAVLLKYEFLTDIVHAWRTAHNNAEFTEFLREMAEQLHQQLPPKSEMDDWGLKYLESLRTENEAAQGAAQRSNLQ